MTIKELQAAKQLMEIEIMLNVPEDPGQTDLRPVFGNIVALIDAEIERQTPVVPAGRYETPQGTVRGVCACGAVVSGTATYCWSCGRKLDWPEVRE